MRVAKGGTDVWCPNCREFTTCKGVSPAEVTGDSDDRDQRRWFAEHPDIAFFQRGRICKVCDHEFVTTEVEVGFLEELIELRGALAQIREHAEAYAKESAKASKSLAALSESLGVLRALKVYREA